MSIATEKYFGNLMWVKPMEWQSMMVNLDINIDCLKRMRTWLYFSPIEREIFQNDYPEFQWMTDDRVVREMYVELLAALN